ncbi:hypothetical protein [Cucumibacter marinus]|uniref:hypothetical protein n=1 Tax=Cucumibacter marinus TaxID=1121252 RepID=UPI00041821E8|nr:hypothetical protein [Cucumibacter marinus]
MFARLAATAAIALASFSSALPAITPVTGVSTALAQAPGVPIASLTPDIVQNFVASYPEVRALTQQLETEFDTETMDEESPAAAFIGFMAYEDAQNRINAVIEPHGFSGFMEWLQTMSAVTQAYAWAEQGGAMDQQMAAAIEQVQNNPGLTDEQKTMMIEQITAASDAMGASRPPQENIDAVNAHADAVRSIFEAE